ncbi:hypothetical protein DL771_011900 [Monosporascus sp. 5C6A]|nr:hypothetical protein DL771_011900 [Monosporascus sp. 5C6A]
MFGATAPGGSTLGATFSAVIGLFAMPSRVQSHRQQKAGDFRHLVLEELDMPGTITGVAALVLINLAWNQAPIAGWSQPYVYVTLILGFLILAVFFAIEIRYATHPLIPFDTLSSDMSFTLGAIACGWGCFGIWIFYSWQLLLVLRAESPLLAASLVSTVVNYGASIALGFAGTVEVNVNNCGLTEADVLKGYGEVLYVVIGLVWFGVVICVAFLVNTKTQRKKSVMDQDKPEA